jgi:transcriptional regulator with PAS, ATPase and Fis domain
MTRSLTSGRGRSMGAEGTFRALVGESARMRHLTTLVDKLGPTQWPVLLIGETGTGKEVVARRIHGGRPDGPFVTIDCSAMVGPLMESELFGHTKGSFTGAHQTKLGLVELAHGGTAFFDEVGELPLDLQAKLLRVLQEKEYRPVGATQARKSDFRVIAATNRDLSKEVQKGTFRSDLFYRLNVVTVRLAPLRDRRDDIPALVQHFLAKYGNGHKVTPEVLDVLAEYDWHGNVRELENCVQHMVAVNSGPLIHTIDLPSTLQNFARDKRLNAMSAAAGAGASAAPYPPASLSPITSLSPISSLSPSSLSPSPGSALESPQPSVTFGSADQPILPLAEVERLAILRALEYTRGDRMAASSLLGIGRTTLYRKLKEYGFQD